MPAVFWRNLCPQETSWALPSTAQNSVPSHYVGQEFVTPHLAVLAVRKAQHRSVWSTVPLHRAQGRQVRIALGAGISSPNRLGHSRNIFLFQVLRPSGKAKQKLVRDQEKWNVVESNKGFTTLILLKQGWGLPLNWHLLRCAFSREKFQGGKLSGFSSCGGSQSFAAGLAWPHNSTEPFLLWHRTSAQQSHAPQTGPSLPHLHSCAKSLSLRHTRCLPLGTELKWDSCRQTQTFLTHPSGSSSLLRLAPCGCACPRLFQHSTWVAARGVTLRYCPRYFPWIERNLRAIVSLWTESADVFATPSSFQTAPVCMLCRWLCCIHRHRLFWYCQHVTPCTRASESWSPVTPGRKSCIFQHACVHCLVKWLSFVIFPNASEQLSNFTHLEDLMVRPM